MRWTLALSTLSLLACTDAPRSLLTDLPAAPPADMAVPPTPPDLTPESISINSVAPSSVSTVGRDQITITGAGFDSRTTFLVGGQPAEVMTVTSTMAVILAPPGQTWGLPVSIQAVRSDGARATNSNGMMSMSRFSYYASTPTFQQIGRYNYNSTNVRVPIVGDFNGDKKDDFILTYVSTAQHQVMLNTGGGSFTLVENQSNPPSQLGVQKGMAVDLNADNFLDWIVADEGGTWAYFMGNGQGLFVNGTLGQNSYANNCSVTNSPTPIKLSSATNNDVAVACTNSSTVRIWQSPAGAATNAFYGTRDTASQHPLISVSNPIHLQVVDVNKDTYNDLVVLSNTNNGPTLYWYNSPGAAPPQQLPTTATGNSGAAGTAGANQLNQNPYWMKCADLNNDQYPDCVVADLNTYTLRVFMNNNGAFQPPSANGTITVGQDPREVNLVDMNGDGKLDILVVSRQFNTFDIIPGRGDGTFGTIVSQDGRTLVGRTTTLLQDCLRPWSIQVGDFDGDGLRDIATTCEANTGGSTTLGAVLIMKNVSK